MKFTKIEPKAVFFLPTLLFLTTMLPIGALGSETKRCVTAVKTPFIDEAGQAIVSRISVPTYHGRIYVSYLYMTEFPNGGGVVRLLVENQSRDAISRDIQRLIESNNLFSSSVKMTLTKSREDSTIVKIEILDKNGATSKFLKTLRSYLNAIYNSSNPKDITTRSLVQWHRKVESSLPFPEFIDQFLHRTSLFLSKLGENDKKVFLKAVYNQSDAKVIEVTEDTLLDHFPQMTKRKFLRATEDIYDDFLTFLKLPPTDVRVLFFDKDYNESAEITGPLLQAKLNNLEDLSKRSVDQLAKIFEGNHQLVKQVTQKMAEFNLRPANKPTQGRSLTLTKYKKVKKRKEREENRYALQDQLLNSPEAFNEAQLTGKDPMGALGSGWKSRDVNHTYTKDHYGETNAGRAVSEISFEERLDLNGNERWKAGLEFQGEGRPSVRSVDKEITGPGSKLTIDDFGFGNELNSLLTRHGLNDPTRLINTTIFDLESIPAMTKTLFYELLEGVGALGYSFPGLPPGKINSQRLALPYNISGPSRFKPTPQD